MPDQYYAVAVSSTYRRGSDAEVVGLKVMDLAQYRSKPTQLFSYIVYTVRSCYRWLITAVRPPPCNVRS